MTYPPSPLNCFVERLASRSALGAEEQQAIHSLPGHAIKIRAHTDVVRLREKVDRVCLVVDGLLGQFHQTCSGDRLITAVHIQGEIPDLCSLVVPHASAGLHALTAATLLRVPHDALWALAQQYPAIMKAFWRESAVNTEILSQWATNLGRRDAAARTAHLLCEMACRYGQVGALEVGTYPFPVTQLDLGDMLGLTPVHVNRTLKALRDKGLAALAGGRAQILDWKRLAALAEFDPFYLHLGRPALTECAKLARVAA